MFVDNNRPYVLKCQEGRGISSIGIGGNRRKYNAVEERKIFFRKVDTKKRIGDTIIAKKKFYYTKFEKKKQ